MASAGHKPETHVDELIIDVARALHDNGEESGRTIEAVQLLALRLGRPMSLIPGWDALTFAFAYQRGSAQTLIAQCDPASVGMNRVAAANTVIDRLGAGGLDVFSASTALARASAAPAANVLLFALACAAGAAALALIFGAHNWQAIALIALSGALGAFLRRSLGAYGIGAIGQSFAAAFIAGSIGSLAVHLNISSDLRLAAVCGCMILVPGPHILNGALDLAALRIPLGVARLTFASLILLGISAGLIAGLHLGGTSLPVLVATRYVPLWIDVPAAGLAVAAYGIFFAMPLRMLAAPVAVGMIAHASRWFALSLLGLNVAAGAGIACLIAGALMVPIAQRLRLPYAGASFACVVSLMPGIFVFRAFSGLLHVQQTPAIVGPAISNTVTATLIVMAMTIGLVVPKSLHRYATRRA